MHSALFFTHLLCFFCNQQITLDAFCPSLYHLTFCVVCNLEMNLTAFCSTFSLYILCSLQPTLLPTRYFSYTLYNFLLFCSFCVVCNEQTAFALLSSTPSYLLDLYCLKSKIYTGCNLSTLYCSICFVLTEANKLH